MSGTNVHCLDARHMNSMNNQAPTIYGSKEPYNKND